MIKYDEQQREVSYG